MSKASHVAMDGPNTFQTPSTQVVARSTQHAIPRFLLKLYEIVNDPANVELVKWSDTGDSFCIYNQERFSRELLGKWFKHQNFSSFVRQLNLYGFRKISALQQGLLLMDHDHDTIQFAHPHFHRGQPDLLSLIQRRRNAPSNAQVEESAVGMLQTSSIASNGNGQSQVVDVRSLVGGINAIRRQQQAIAADLSALKQSNDALWKEAIEARERHSKHEDTINCILKFLAGIFGGFMQGRGEQLRSDKRAPSRRLLIEGRRPSYGEGSRVGSDIDRSSDAGRDVVSERFSTVKFPEPSVASPSSTETKTLLSSSYAQQQQNGSGARGDTSLSATTLPPPASMPSLASTQNISNPERAWNTTLQQLLTSPTQSQNLLQALTTAQPSDISLDDGVTAAASQQLLVPSALSSSVVVDPANNSLNGPAVPPGVDSQEAAVLRDASRNQKAYQDVHEINADVNDLQTNLNWLIRDMGLDPNALAFPAVAIPTSTPGAPATVTSAPAVTDDLAQGHADFSFDTWLNQLGNSEVPDPMSPSQGEAPEDFSAFLDTPALEEQPAAGGSSDVPAPVFATECSPLGTKRKMDLVDTPEADMPSSKKKR